MGGKAKFKKHTAADLERRQKQVNKGGGKTGATTRASAKLNFTCDICMSASPDIKSYEQHYVSKHPKATFDRDGMVAKAEALRDAQQDHTLKPGVIKVHVEREKDVQSFFTAGGFALTHANSVTDIACAELVKVEDIDPEAAQAGLTKYQAQLASAPEGSEDKLNAQIGVDTHAAMVAAVVSN
uniref:Uncharacterized protein n=1 Tax=Phytophthora ramorum TaxID=164328 RepID=H3H198_PHYRM